MRNAALRPAAATPRTRRKKMVGARPTNPTTRSTQRGVAVVPKSRPVVKKKVSESKTCSPILFLLSHKGL